MPGPSNLYGVANPVILPTTLMVFGPVACPIATETPVLSTAPLIAPSSGYFYPIVWYDVTLGTGATGPNSVNISANIGGGSFFDSAYYAALNAMVSAYVFVGGALLGPSSNVAWRAPGSIVNLTVNPSGQPISTYNIHAVVALFRAPDQ